MKINAPVTVGMEPQDAADIVGVPLVDLLNYGNGWAAVPNDPQPISLATLSLKEGVEEQEGEAEAPKAKPKRKRKTKTKTKAVKADG